MKSTNKKPRTKTAVASSRRGLRGVGNPIVAAKAADAGLDIAKDTFPFILKGLFVLGVGYLIFRGYKNRFIKKPENNNYPIANITLAEAESRANTIYGAVGIFSGDFDTIVNAFSHPQGLNYNALIRIYNAFGNRKSTYLSSEMNLSEWLSDQLNSYQLQQISTITSGVIV